MLISVLNSVQSPSLHCKPQVSTHMRDDVIVTLHDVILISSNPSAIKMTSPCILGYLFVKLSACMLAHGLHI